MNIFRSLCSLLSGMLCPIFLQLGSTCHLSQFKCHLLRETSNSSTTCYISFLFSLFFFLKWSMHACMLSYSSHVRLFVTLWTVAHQTPLSMRFSRQEYWSGSPCPSPGDLPYPEIKCASNISPGLAGGFFIITANWKVPNWSIVDL